MSDVDAKIAESLVALFEKKKQIWMAYVERHNLSLLIVFVITIVCKLHVVSIRYIMTYDKT